MSARKRESEAANVNAGKAPKAFELLGLTEPPPVSETKRHADLRKATDAQLLRHALTIGDDDPVYWGLIQLADGELEAMYEESDSAQKGWITLMQQRIRVFAELHRRMIDALAKRGAS